MSSSVLFTWVLSHKEELLCTLVFLPLIASLLATLSSTLNPSKALGFVCSLLISVSFIISCLLLYFIASSDMQSFHVVLWNFIETGQFQVTFSLMFDKINAIMIFVVTLVSSMVHFYSIGYMSHDKGFNRFFAYLGGFVFSMLLLVGGDNLLILFIGWEGVGTCSYLLIGFWYQKKSANAASIEAFVMNRVADLGMLLGIFLVHVTVGSLSYNDIFVALATNPPSNMITTWIAILLFIGAMGKSAQFPLHTWLANAMEGPTPVSALIHAATMVTAGVYLIIRLAPIYSLVLHVAYFIACLGAFVAIFASLMAIVNRDLKRIIAYSTLSQLGYMFVAAGLGAYWIALFHLFTHAFFKSLLFLGAGNIMHAMNDKLDITKMGGLSQSLRISMIFMLIGSVALCGIPPLAGYFSKDKILEVAFTQHEYIIWAVLLLGAICTAFYSFRLYTLVFIAPKNHNEHPHEASKIMLYAMLPLAVLAIIAGLFHEQFSHFLSSALLPVEIHVENLYLLIALTLGLVLASILLAYMMYKKGYKEKSHYNILHKILSNEYYIPQLYRILFVKPFGFVSDLFYHIIDMGIIDKIVDSVGKLFLLISYVLRPIQNGNLSSMLRTMSMGVVAILMIMLLYFILV
ncbi:NADH-quinone oxidoreductase subunit L [Helicobacter sp. MIT 14-3879]|uniref:NADH-quinone oxidoreductase subunit L n=1 Tax=Helicobacter sp. MIT 14-3879 TaxID=2040649 RepID=UPI000E1ED596|nr:NADH-quinone oxidoreductase subunit L [Helicobacter sp. MIT 14-3879]RDU59594.1 NADH-quinone oxidoreductase subunit L [Helicobacter sp. MIT 14-3879]